MPEFFKTIWDGVTYDVVKIIFLSFVMTAAMDRIAKIFTDRLKEWRQQVIFSGCSFLIFMAVFSILGSHNIRPNIEGSIANVISGPSGPKQTVAVFSITLINSGTMQTIVKNWHVSAGINGRKYDAVFGIMPSVFTFNNIPNASKYQPTSVTYHSEDNLIERTTKPVEIGGQTSGILFVAFDEIDPDVFKTGVDYEVSYEDVLSKPYKLTISSSARSDQISAMPGVHTELACPLPPGGAQKFTPLTKVPERAN